MDTKLQILAITLACIVILIPDAEARAAKDCKAHIADFLSCMPIIRNGDPSAPKPTNECCTALENADLPCLCSSYPELAMALPGKCKLTVPKECH
ncbi:putative lipid-transfer protein DIR1 [Carex littledalei]|uniref:Putative lipid-transfer protein DIR1 n=1 Tax=Carex littledalei TaxID=544730 RepID=A0A833QQB4_9POAL|nr:putative lipid-transfer protein DIR1 [Carex littledalei]